MSKIQMFEKIQEDTGIVFDDMLFFDDSQDNIDEAKGYGIESYQAKPLEDKHFEIIDKFFEGKKTQAHQD